MLTNGLKLKILQKVHICNIITLYYNIKMTYYGPKGNEKYLQITTHRTSLFHLQLFNLYFKFALNKNS